MGGRAPENRDLETVAAPSESPWLAAAGVAALIFVLLVANGRPIGAGDTRASERVAASLVQELDFDLDEYPEVAEPFARELGGRRVSIYPVLSAVLAAPVLYAAKLAFPLDETGSAFAGKLAASLLSALAAGILFLVVCRRWPASTALGTAVVFALGTSVWATSQGLWQHPAVVLFLSLALLFVLRAADGEEAWAGRAGLPLALAVAARHAEAPLVAVFALGIAARWPRRLPALVAWALPGAAFVALYGAAYLGSPLAQAFPDAASRFTTPWGLGQLGLLVSPGKGLLFFTPVAAIAAVGLAQAWRFGERWLAGTLGLALLAQLVFLGRWGEWHGGECWGPRLLTGALPLLFVFLPWGLERLPTLGVLAAALSIGVQALGAFAYDYRWERLYQRPPNPAHPELWSLAESPILFHLREHAFVLARPALEGGRLVIREHRLVPFGPTGSRLRFVGGRVQVGGSEANAGDVILLRGARVEDDRLQLARNWDGLFLRVQPGARSRPLELRVRGAGEGSLYVGEQTFWSAPRYTTYSMSGRFRIRHAWSHPDSGGADLTLTLGRGKGRAAIESVSLVAPGDPEQTLELAEPR